MEVIDGRIVMSDEEWARFAAATFAPWRPRTPAEFNAMADLGSARHMAENTRGIGGFLAAAAEGIKFGRNGEIKFPPNQRKLAFAKEYGTWPTTEQLRRFEFNVNALGRPPLKLVR
jgi:hypothetical protein